MLPCLGSDESGTEPSTNDTVTVDFTDQPGVPMYVSVVLETRDGLLVEHHSPGLVSDTTAPAVGQVICPRYLSSAAELFFCAISGFVDAESGVESLVYTMEGDLPIGSTSGSIESVTASMITVQRPQNMPAGSNYYVTVTATNGVGLTAVGTSNAIMLDATPPKAGSVAFASDFATIDEQTSVVTVQQPMQCATSLSKVVVTWKAFSDDQSGIAYYEVALGSSAGLLDIHQFVTVLSDVRRHTFDGLNLVDVKYLYATVRGFNQVGLYTSVNTAAMPLSGTGFMSQSTGTQSTVRVLDGLQKNTDM